MRKLPILLILLLTAIIATALPLRVRWTPAGFVVNTITGKLTIQEQQQAQSLSYVQERLAIVSKSLDSTKNFFDYLLRVTQQQPQLANERAELTRLVSLVNDANNAVQNARQKVVQSLGNPFTGPTLYQSCLQARCSFYNQDPVRNQLALQNPAAAGCGSTTAVTDVQQGVCCCPFVFNADAFSQLVQALRDAKQATNRVKSELESAVSRLEPLMQFVRIQTQTPRLDFQSGIISSLQTAMYQFDFAFSQLGVPAEAPIPAPAPAPAPTPPAAQPTVPSAAPSVPPPAPVPQCTDTKVRQGLEASQCPSPKTFTITAYGVGSRGRYNMIKCCEPVPAAPAPLAPVPAAPPAAITPPTPVAPPVPTPPAVAAPAPTEPTTTEPCKQKGCEPKFVGFGRRARDKSRSLSIALANPSSVGCASAVMLTDQPYSVCCCPAAPVPAPAEVPIPTPPLTIPVPPLPTPVKEREVAESRLTEAQRLFAERQADVQRLQEQVRAAEQVVEQARGELQAARAPAAPPVTTPSPPAAPLPPTTPPAQQQVQQAVPAVQAPAAPPAAQFTGNENMLQMFDILKKYCQRTGDNFVCPKPPAPLPRCIDSDGGVSPAVQGTIFVPLGDTGIGITTDSCFQQKGTNYVAEWTCAFTPQGQPAGRSAPIACGGRCEQGRCV